MKKPIENGGCKYVSCKGHGYTCCWACDLNVTKSACIGCDEDPEKCKYFEPPKEGIKYVG